MASEPSQDLRDFHEQLKATLPRLRIYALSLPAIVTRLMT